MSEETATTETETTTEAEKNGGGGDQVTMSKAEADAMKREVAEARKAARKAQSEAAKTAEDDAKRKGDYEAAAKAAEDRATKAEEHAQKVERDVRVTSVAARLKARNPKLAAAALKENGAGDDVFDDESKLEAAFKQLRKDEPYLFAEETRRTGGTVDPARKASASMDDLIRERAGRA